eukprot:318741_1
MSQCYCCSYHNFEVFEIKKLNKKIDKHTYPNDILSYRCMLFTNNNLITAILCHYAVDIKNIPRNHSIIKAKRLRLIEDTIRGNMYIITDYKIVANHEQTLGLNYKYKPLFFLTNIAILKMLHYPPNNDLIIVQIIDLIKINSAIVEIVINDGIHMAHCDGKDVCALLNSNHNSVSIYDIVQVSKWDRTKTNTNTVIINILSMNFISKFNQIIGSPIPHYYQYQKIKRSIYNHNILNFLFSKCIVSRIQHIKFVFSCVHQKNVKQVEKWGYEYPNLVEDCLKTLPILIDNEMNTQQTWLLSVINHQWIFCEHCALDFIINPKNFNILIASLKSRCKFTRINNNPHGVPATDTLCGEILHKIFHYPRLLRFLFKNCWKLLITYWLVTLQMFKLMSKTKIMLNISLQSLRLIEFCILKFFEMKYIKTKHIEYILKFTPTIMDDLLNALRISHLNDTLYMYRWNRAQSAHIELNPTYRIMINLLICIKTVAKKHKVEYIGFMVQLFNEKTDRVNNYSSMLKFGQKYIYQLGNRLRHITADDKQILRENTKRWRVIGRECQTVGCHKRGTSLKICKGCKLVYYCSIKCQKIDWSKFDHRNHCKIFDLKQFDFNCNPSELV